ncbi:Oidioi.mRNA.OKI2018_I69.chr1.g3391.t1.cds [Oikopleura dioica]|uniref:Oidioi.mRNA.OKI2018_I69.chr1.g3391.t1.cds n=1 Tax=Oikopleura dioica TaxID=34765 RepID=A0ABN7T0F8_OIKDI|nr:Oidioi.mRNA.OKI2018_I69.chr1.g3391.t1.cds [Oikopleura dioica]
MKVTFICPEERETGSEWSESESDSEELSRQLVVDEVQEGPILAPAYHFAPCYCFRDNVYQFDDYQIIYEPDFMADQLNYNNITNFPPLSRTGSNASIGTQLMPLSHSPPPRSGPGGPGPQQITGPILVQSGGQTFTLVPNTFEARASMEGKVESKTNIYIKIRPLRERYHLQTLNQVENYLREIFASVTASMSLDREKRSTITPKVTVPEVSQEFLFVDFESKLPGLSIDVAKRFVTEINDLVGPNTAQYAKEKLRDKTNVYFQPLPFNCTKEDLQECIADKLKQNQMDIDWSSNEVTCHVQAGKDGKNPVGFCRLPTQDHAQTVIDLMNNRQWADVGIKYALSEPCLRLVVKLANAKANRSRQTVIFAEGSQFMNQPIQIVASPVQIVPIQGSPHPHQPYPQPIPIQLEPIQPTSLHHSSSQTSITAPPPLTSQPSLTNLNTFAAVDAAFGIPPQVPYTGDFFSSSIPMVDIPIGATTATTHYTPIIGPFGSPERGQMTDSLSSFPSNTNTSNCYHPLTNPTF